MLYFFSGGNDFLALKELAGLREEFLAKNPLANVNVFDLEEDGETEKFLEKMSSGSGFFAKKSFLVIKKFSRLNVGEEKKIINILSKINQQDVVIFFHQETKTSKGKLLDYLKKEAKIKNFPELNEQSLRIWVEKELEERSQKKVFFDPLARERLIFLCNGNLWKINSEIDKLINFIDEGRISQETVDFFLENRENVGKFDLVEAIGSKDKKRAINILLNMLKNKEDGFLILGSIIGLFRNLAKVYGLFKKGFNLNSLEAQKLKMHPFVMQKTANQLRNFSLKEIRDFYAQALQLDQDVKLGKLKIEEALVEIIFKLK